MPEMEYLAMRKREKTNGASVAAAVPDDAWFADQYPRITEYLADVKWDDGTPREPSTLSIGFVDGGVRIALNDKDGRQSAYTNAHTVQDALKALEDALEADLVTWRAWDRKKKG